MTDLTRSREHLAADLARILVSEGMDADFAKSLATEALSRVTFDACGLAVGLGSVVAELKARDADILGSFTKATGDADNRSSLDREMDAARSAAQADREARVAEIRNGGNPFARKSWSVTRQGLLANLAPEVAAKLQAEAGL